MGTADRRDAGKLAREWAKGLDEHFARERKPMMLSAGIADFIQECRSARLAVNTVRGYGQIMNRVLALVGDEDVSAWSEDVAFDKVTGFLNARRGEVKNIAKDRITVNTFFNYAKSKRWYGGENPATGKLHRLRQPRKGFVKPERRTTSAWRAPRTDDGGQAPGKRVRLRVVKDATPVARRHSSGHSRKRAGGKGAQAVS